jgi:outer membrane protein OmpA-like peptidoglycan-associated protein/opacity protein-like surface antigen
MRLGTRIITTMAVAFLLAPTLLLCADDTATPAATAKKDMAVNSRAARVALAKALSPITAPERLPASPMPQSRGADSYTPRFELFLGYSNFRAVPMSGAGNRIAWLSGGSTSLAINANRYLGFVADFGGYHANKFGPDAPPTGGVVNASGNVFTYMVGPRLSLRHGRVTPFAQALFGGVYASDVTVNGCSGVGCTPLPSENAFTMTAGGGLDITLTHHVALRLFQAEYLMTRFADRSSSAGQTARQDDLRLSAGIVFRFGGNHPVPPPPPPPPNRPPVASCSADKSMVYAESGDVVAVRVQASSPDNNPLTYTWTATGGAVEGSGPEVRWNSSGGAAGTYTAKVRVDDGRGGTADCSVDIRVEPRPNRPPTMSCSADRHSIMVGERLQITATASNPDNAPLTYSWRTTGGQIIGSGASVSFDSSGLAPGHNTVTGHVDDGRGGTAECSVDFDVQMPQATAAQTELETRLALHSIYFPTAQPTPENPNGGLMASQQDILRTLAVDFKKYLEFKPDAHLTLEGHADQRGSVEYNKALTDRRVARSMSFLVEQGVPAGSIETRSFGKEQNLDTAQVREQMEQNPDLTPGERQKLFSNMQVIVLAQNRRVDVVLSTTGQQSVRRYPFNAKDALTLINTARTGTAKRTMPAAKRVPKK